MRAHKAANGDFSERGFKASVVHLILIGKVEAALQRLAEHYNVETPKIRVGLPRRHRAKTAGCYTAKNATICLLNSDVLKDPFIILHEFYHHLRTSIEKEHKGTERYANTFAQSYIEAYQLRKDFSANNACA